MKIKSIKFTNHPILGNLLLDFCDLSGNPVDTVIIAGENGTGKSTLLNEIYDILTGNIHCDVLMKAEIGGREVSFKYFLKSLGSGQVIWSLMVGNTNVSISSNPHKAHFAAIFSDVDIHFTSEPISSVTALDIDKQNTSRRSKPNLSREIQQLLVDIQALDDARLSQMIRQHAGETICIDDSMLSGRLDRFISAFDYMYDGTLKYDGIENTGNRKAIVFRRNGKKVYLDNLSSGEKQIIYRGSFLLRDRNALNGVVVLLDEPEISMHPEWQKRIMNFYRRMFTNTSGKQTSQIFAVTHSPFIVHNEHRENDKVIVLTRAEQGTIVVSDKPEYYSCNTVEAISDAFHHRWYMPERNTVYVEGTTDERYLQCVIDTFDLQVPFDIKWIGHLSSSGQEEFTGADSLDKAYKFSLAAGYQFEQVFLFDCDVKKKAADSNHSHTRIMPRFENSRFKVGIENALCIDSIENIDWSEFYEEKVSMGDYGEVKKLTFFRKQHFCEYICTLDIDTRKQVFANLHAVVLDLVSGMDGKNPSCSTFS